MGVIRKSSAKDKVKIGIVGCGGIGEGVAIFIDKHLKDKVKLVALAERDIGKAKQLQRKLTQTPRILDIGTLIKKVDFIIEAASQECAEFILRKAIHLSSKISSISRKSIIILSVGALIKNKILLKEADKKGLTIYIPSGAICGVDGLGALGLGTIKKISLITSKPPYALCGVEYLSKKGIDVMKIKKEKVVFQGTVETATKHFPQNINVAATLLIASTLPRRDISAASGSSNFSSFSSKNIKVYIKVNPRLKRNMHRIEIEAKEAKVSIAVENVPSKINPKTSTLAILSTQHLLRKIFSSFKVGS